jgi:hypothetical protein
MATASTSQRSHRYAGSSGPLCPTRRPCGHKLSAQSSSTGQNIQLLHVQGRDDPEMTKSGFAPRRVCRDAAHADQQGVDDGFHTGQSASGRKFRTLSLMDGFTREAPRIEVDISLTDRAWCGCWTRSPESARSDSSGQWAGVHQSRGGPVGLHVHSSNRASRCRMASSKAST